MALASGARLGAYEILSPLGSGGMGEVYRARDLKLKREVALKVLPADVANDRERLARFQREAEVLAALNHPNIAQIHGIEESNGTTALVMELVEGEDLAQRIARGAIPVDEALPIVGQIAEALEAAHEQGIIHRDLKPANIKVRPDGTVKVLDFGLAKTLDGTGQAGLASGDFANLPTITSPAMTMRGVILGTAAYMSPEQARARPVDRRTDIWAFGCVLYETVTGKRAFDGETMTDVIGAIMRTDPIRTQSTATLHPRLRALLDRCLQKEVRNRWQSIGDVRLEIEKLQRDPDDFWADRIRQVPRRSLSAPWLALAVVTLAAVTGLIGWRWRPAPAQNAEPVRFSFALPPVSNFGLGMGRLAVSPDGRHIAYATDERLYLRTLGEFESRSVANSAGAGSLFFSPDSAWLGFHAGGRLQRVPVTGGAALTIASVGLTTGASWGPDDTIVFGGGVGAGLLRVAASGGTPSPVTTADARKGEVSHGLPHFLPNGDLLFTVGTGEGSRIAALSSATGQWHEILRPGAGARYLESGYFAFSETGNVRVVPFDPNRLTVTGPVVPVLDGVVWQSSAGLEDAWFAAAGDNLVYVPGARQDPETKPVWVDRAGRETAITVTPGFYVGPALSRDGRYVAFSRLSQNDGVGQMWVLEVERNSLFPVSSLGADYNPTWIPGGEGRFTYTSNGDLFELQVGRRDPPVPLLSRDYYQFPTSWSADGRVLAFLDITPARIEAWTMQRGQAPERLVDSSANVGNIMFSPAGNWLAYVSDETGKFEVYVRAYPGTDRGTKVSTDGGEQPVWSADGSELFYRNADRMMAVAISAGTTLVAGPPRELWKRPYFTQSFLRPNYDVARDRRFLMLQVSKGSINEAQSVNVVLHWFDEVKRGLAASK